MIRRYAFVLCLLSSAAASVSAQGKKNDPDVKAAGGGALPAGWRGRTDQASAKLADAKFTTAGKDYRVTSGPAAIYWRARDAAKGPYVANATFRQMKNPSHPEAFGLVFMARDLTGDKQNYAYFLVRGDGKCMVNHRAGPDVHKIVEWTTHAAVTKADANGVSTNTLTVDASRPDSLRLLVNGKQVHALDSKYLGSTDGVVGLRVNHNLDVQISGFAVAPKKKK